MRPFASRLASTYGGYTHTNRAGIKLSSGGGHFRKCFKFFTQILEFETNALV